MNKENIRKSRWLFVLTQLLLFLACIAVSLFIWLIVHFAGADTGHEKNTAAVPEVISESECVVL